MLFTLCKNNWNEIQIKISDMFSCITYIWCVGNVRFMVTQSKFGGQSSNSSQLYFVHFPLINVDNTWIRLYLSIWLNKRADTALLMVQSTRLTDGKAISEFGDFQTYYTRIPCHHFFRKLWWILFFFRSSYLDIQKKTSRSCIKIGMTLRWHSLS